LFQMKMKLWDDPVDFNKFEVSLRRLDPSFSDGQCKALFTKLKGPDGLVDVQTLMSNICGTVHETVDYRNKMFKDLYQEIYAAGKQDKLLKLMENKDKQSDGKLEPSVLQALLKQITGSKFTDEELLKFVRQLQKDDKYMVNYIEFLDKMTSLGNKEHNPFKNLVSRLAFFLENNKVTVSDLLKRLGGGEPVSVSKFTDFLKQKIEKRKGQPELFGFSQYMDIDKDGYISVEDLKTCLRNLTSTAFFQHGSSSLSTSQFNSSLKFFPTDMQADLTDELLIKVTK